MSIHVKTACRRCREQKLKCSRELPECARCLKFNIACAYPAPPDRKMLAALRAPPERRRRPSHSRVKRTVHHQPPQQTFSNSPGCPSPVGEVGQGLGDGSIAGLDIEISTDVQDFFQEVYFSCQFHSTLLFHRPTFLLAFEQGQVPQDVLLALYCNATIFLPEKSLLYAQNAPLLKPLGDLKSLGRRWALRAGRNVLQDIDRPTFAGVQVCEMLCLYWFSEGDYQRHAMFLSIAYKAATLLGLDTKHGVAPLPGTNGNSDSSNEWLSAEMARRCFWAIWFTQCISSDNQLTDIIFSDRVMDLPLPISEVSFLRNRQEQPFRSLSSMQSSSANTENARSLPKPSISAELMGIILYWAKIRKLLESRKRKSPSVWLTEVFELDSYLLKWRSRLPQSFQYAKRTLYDQFATNQQSLFVLMHALHRQCRLVLHASLVPQFSGLELPTEIPREVASVSARIACNSAEEISCLASDLLAMEWDPAKVPAFVGYCLYASATVHIAVLGVGDAALARRARTHLASTLRLLKSLKLYWSVLRQLWTRINILYVTQMRHLRTTDVQNTTSVFRHSSTQPEPKDLDQLAGEVRDPGRLAEPLADSVLEYSLQRLRPAHDASSRAAQAQSSNEATLEDQLDELFEETPPASQPSAINPGFLNEEGMGESLENQAYSHLLSAEPALCEPAQLFETSQDNILSLTAWDTWGFTMGNPRPPNYNPFELSGDL